METATKEPKTANSKKCIGWCNKMLRGERSAVEAYQKTIEKHGSDPQLDKLTEIQAEHRQSVTDLEERVVAMGGTPETDSGAWGIVAKTIQTAANLFGSGSAVEALQEGEKIGLRDYESALASGDLSDPCIDLFRDRLMPRIKDHLTNLESVGKVVN